MPVANLNRVRLALFALLAAFALMLGMPSLAHAVILGDDYVGNTTVNDRGLSITEAPAVEARYGLLCDADGTVLWSRGADEQSAMASITKIMTAIVALENGNLDDTITISANAASVGESSAGISEGQTYKLYDLLCALMVHSGNDASMAIAEGIAESESDFVDLMNAKAEELGLKNTHFENPHGLDADGHYSSATDIAIMARYGMHNETFRKIVGMSEIKLNGDTLMGTNALLASWDSCIGVKTGFTYNAGECLAAAASKDGVELYAVVLGSSDEVQRFIDAYKLLDWGYTHYRNFKLAGAEDVLADAPMSGYLNRTVKAGVAKDVNALALDFSGDISVDVRLIDIPDGIKEGDTVGTVTWHQGESVVASVPLVAKESVGGPFPPFTVITSLVRLVGLVTGDEGVADSVLHAQTIQVERVESTAGQGMDAKLEKKIRAYVSEYNASL